MNERRSLTAWLPLYSVAQRFLLVVDGSSYGQLKHMVDTILAQRGTPQNTVNWSDPDEWIPERLKGDDKRMASRLWEESRHSVNPRYCSGLISLSNTHNLIAYEADTVSLTDDGKRFLKGDEKLLARMDDYDGLLLLLAEVAAKGPGRRRDFEERYTEFCRASTTYAADSSIASSLIYRLRNLVDRGLISKTGHSYQVTHMGLEYLGRHGNERNGDGPNPAIARLASANNATARQQLSQFLQSMNPYLFEHLVKLLLEEMGYEDVEVTPASNDKGVDVVANLELGISRVREVVQVKRYKGNIGQPVLNQLRGSLPLFGAMRGSIITTGGFTKQAQAAAFVAGAAPITLIDGERLLDLLIEHNIGVRRREIRILEFDAESLSEFESEHELESASINE